MLFHITWKKDGRKRKESNWVLNSGTKLPGNQIQGPIFHMNRWKVYTESQIKTYGRWMVSPQIHCIVYLGSSPIKLTATK
jgi:hypothetical protein